MIPGVCSSSQLGKPFPLRVPRAAVFPMLNLNWNLRAVGLKSGPEPPFLVPIFGSGTILRSKLTLANDSKREGNGRILGGSQSGKRNRATYLGPETPSSRSSWIVS